MVEKIDQIENSLTILHEIAIGGQKSVFLATHPIYGKIAFKKVCNLDNETKLRMEREAKILRESNSDSFPKLYEIVFSEDNLRCIILEEYIDSNTLTNVMQDYFEPKKALFLIRELVCILSVIWDKNIVHRDIKPDNILIDSTGKVVIIDFGCARELDEKTITEFGGAPLTKAYAAPEQLLYNKTRITTRTDQFPLGIILGQLLFKGTHPFDPSLTKEPNLITSILNNNWYRTGTKNYPKLSNLLERLLQPQSHSRFPSTIRILEAIEDVTGEIE